ncbi:ATM1 [Auxenochlorella protothecoides x Auxenochlorella symbiontica]
MSATHTLSRAIEDAVLHLSSSKAAGRKEGLKQVNRLLDSQDCIHLLDHRTACVGMAIRIPMDTWPGLALALSSAVRDDMQATQRRRARPDIQWSKTLRRVLQGAEDEGRPGRCPQPLLHCAGKLMLHVLDTLGDLEEDEGEPGYAAEAWTMLRLLAQHPAYCQAAAAGTVLGLFQLCGTWLGREGALTSGEPAIRMLGTLRCLAVAAPAAVGPLPQSHLYQAVVANADRLADLRDDPRLARALLAALNPLLLAQGRGLAREALTPLLAALLPLAGRALRGPQREARVREEAVLQLRVQLAMRPLLADLATMTRWVLRELEAPHFCFWGDAAARQLQLGPTGPVTAAFPPQMAGFLLLAGEVLARGTAAAGAVPSKAPNPLQESLAPFLADLPSALQSRPLIWCPLLCSVLLSSADVPGNLLCNWLKAGVELLEVCAPASMPSRAGDALWALRLAHALLAVMPSSDGCEGLWERLAACLERQLSSDSDPAAGGSAALAALHDLCLDVLCSLSQRAASAQPALRAFLASGSRRLVRPPHADVQALRHALRAEWGGPHALRLADLGRAWLEVVEAAQMGPLADAILGGDHAPIHSTQVWHAGEEEGCQEDPSIPPGAWAWLPRGPDPATAGQLAVLARGDAWFRDYLACSRCGETEVDPSPAAGPTPVWQAPQRQHDMVAEALARRLNKCIADEARGSEGELDEAGTNEGEAGPHSHLPVAGTPAPAPLPRPISLEEVGVLRAALQVSARQVCASPGSPAWASDGAFWMAAGRATLRLLGRLETRDAWVPGGAALARALHAAFEALDGQMCRVSGPACVLLDDTLPQRFVRAMEGLQASYEAASIAASAGPFESAQAQAARSSPAPLLSPGFDDDLDLGPASKRQRLTPPTGTSGGTAPHDSGGMTRRDCITLLAALLPLDAERGALLAASWLQAEVEDSTARRPALPLADRLDLVRIQCEAAALGLARPWTPAEGLTGATEGALEALDGPVGMLSWRAAPAPRLIAWARCCIPLARVIPIAKHKGDGQLLRGLCAQFVRCIDMLPGRFDARLAVLGPVCVELARAAKALLAAGAASVEGNPGTFWQSCQDLALRLLGLSNFLAGVAGSDLFRAMAGSITGPAQDTLWTQWSVALRQSGPRLDESGRIPRCAEELMLLALGVAATCLPGASPNAVRCMILQVADAGKDPALVATLAAMLDGVGSGLGYSGRHGLLRRLLDRLVHEVHGAGLAPERLLWVMQGLGVDARDSLALDSVAVGAWAQFPDVLREEMLGRARALAPQCIAWEAMQAGRCSVASLQSKLQEVFDVQGVLSERLEEVVGAMLKLTDSGPDSKPRGDAPSSPIVKILLALLSPLQLQSLTTIPVALRLLSGIQEALSWGGPPSHRALSLSALASLADVLALAEEPLSPGDPSTHGLGCAPIARAVAVLALRQLSRRALQRQCSQIMARVLEGVGPGQAPGLAIMLFPRVDAFASVADTAAELAALRDRLVLILNRANDMLLVQGISSRPYLLESEAPPTSHLANLRALLSALPELNATQRARWLKRAAKAIGSSPVLEAGPGVQEAVMQLARRAHDLEDEYLVGLAGSLLARLGPSTEEDPGAEASQPTSCTTSSSLAGTHLGSAPSQATPSSGTGPPLRGLPARPSARAPHKGEAVPGPASAPSLLAPPWPLLFEALAAATLDADVGVVAATLRALPGIMAQAPVLAALADADAETRRFLGAWSDAGSQQRAGEDPREAFRNQPGLTSPELWTAGAGREGWQAWVCRLASTALSMVAAPELAALAEVASLQPGIAAMLLPCAMGQLAVGADSSSLAVELGAVLSACFSAEDRLHGPAEHTVLGLINHLRCLHIAAAQLPNRGTHLSTLGWAKVYWIDIDPLVVARLALEAGELAFAVLFGELALVDARGDRDQTGACENLLASALGCLGEPDGLYAVTYSPSLEAQIRRSEHEGDWPWALLGHDLILRMASCRPTRADHAASEVQHLAGLRRSLDSLGATWSAAHLPPPSGRTAVVRALGLASWDAPGEALGEAPGEAGEEVCEALTSLGADCPERAQVAAWRGMRRLLGSGRGEDAGIAGRGVLLAQLQGLQGVLEVCEALEPGSGPAKVEAEALDMVWARREAALLASCPEPAALEALQAVHVRLGAAARCAGLEAGALRRSARAARKAGRHASATSALYALRMLRELGAGAAAGAIADPVPALTWRVEEAKVLWARGQTDVALRLAGELLAREERGTADGTGNVSPARRRDTAALRLLAAKWQARARHSGSSADTLRALQSAADALGALDDGAAATLRTLCRAHYRLAHYADGLHRAVRARRAGDEWRAARAVVAAKKAQAGDLRARLARRGAGRSARSEPGDKEARSLELQLAALDKAVRMDEEEHAAVEEREEQMLRVALHNYARCLSTGQLYDLPVAFRFVQLWLELGPRIAWVNDHAAEAFQDAPSHKFLPLVYQVASRLSTDAGAGAAPAAGPGFQAVLTELLERLCRDHPFHALFQVLALKNGDRGRDGRRGVSRPGMTYAVDHAKVAAAEALVARLKAAGAPPAARELVAQMEMLIDVYIELAAAPAPKDGHPIPFPAALRRSTRAMPRVPVASASLAVDPSCRYEDVPTLVSFGDRLTFVGGINRPKLVSCVDSAGREHRQLLKSGSDDLRQDAVMQQFFWLLNQLLQADAGARSRRLSLQTYRVVPFSPAAGLLAWVEDTVPLADYLIGPGKRSGAHARYRAPGEYSFEQCWNRMHQAGGAGRRRQREAFDDVCAHFPPVLQHFFLERFHSPGAWHTARLAYVRSVAAASMAGHVIGLGDRHCQNILLQLRGGEVVHIDLGIAFEQGKFLNTPEVVPFRLTPDLVAAMGPHGVDGVMTRCCEAVLRVVRAHSESVLTVIEVFIHDPLYRWALTVPQAHARQAGNEGGGLSEGPGAAGVINADAERTILRIKQKLRGAEGGDGDAQGVEGQVQRLLQEAMDPDNLSRMYIGWAPWL